MFQCIYKKKLIDRKQNNLTDWILFFIFEGVMLVSLFLVLQSIIDILLHTNLSIKFGLLTLMDGLEGIFEYFDTYPNFTVLQECRIVYDDAINQPQIAAMEHVIQHVKQECTTPE